MNQTLNPMWLRAPGGWVAGVFKGFAERLNIEVWILRAIFLVSFFYFGFGLLFYIFLAVSLPRKDDPELGLRRRLLGVCKDIALKYDIEVGLVRFSFCLLTICSIGLSIFGYVVLYFVMPKEKNAQKI